jgi:hypothetical protein
VAEFAVSHGFVSLRGVGSLFKALMELMQAVFVCTTLLMNEVRSSSHTQALRHWPVLNLVSQAFLAPPNKVPRKLLLVECYSRPRYQLCTQATIKDA